LEYELGFEDQIRLLGSATFPRVVRNGKGARNLHYSPLLILHITGGTVGLLSGAAAMTFRKGSRGHGLAGSVFVVSMLTMSGAGTILATMKSEVSNICGGVMTFYMVTTAWLTARRHTGRPGLLDWGAMLFAAGVGIGMYTLGARVAMGLSGANGVPLPMYFIMGSIALLAAAGDLRMLLRGGVVAVARIVRHLWRMCFALFVATGSIFLARPHLFPAVLRDTHVIFVLGILPLPLLIFWLIRVRFTEMFRKNPTPRADAVSAVRA
jgi:hypothetical protein